MVLVSDERISIVAYFDAMPTTIHIEYNHWGGRTWYVILEKNFLDVFGLHRSDGKMI